MNRYTFVIQIHPNGPSTLENLSTNERVRISDLDAVGPQLERWLDILAGVQPPKGAGEGSAIGPDERSKQGT